MSHSSAESRSAPAPRIVTLIASATEIVSALGFRGAIVGRSHECDYPPDIAAAPVLTAPKFPLDGSSGQIDRHVKALVETGSSVYRVDAEALRRLAPDVIVTQDHCEVCAVSLADVERAICDWTGTQVRVVSCRPNGLPDVWSDIRRIADALGEPQAGDRLVFDIQARMNKVAAKAAAAPKRPRVLCVEWVDPLMAGAGWLPEMVTMAGGAPLLAEAGQLSQWITWEQAVAAQPDVIVVMPCGYDIARASADMPILEALPGYADLPAVRQGRVAIADGNQYFNRPGPRLAESLEIMAEILHPELFDFGHQGRGWVSCPPLRAA
jgi:iron complex transport system substrate-binding protein